MRVNREPLGDKKILPNRIMKRRRFSSSLRASSRNQVKLLHQRKDIEILPGFNNHTAIDSEDNDVGKGHLLARAGNSEQLSRVSAPVSVSRTTTLSRSAIDSSIVR